MTSRISDGGNGRYLSSMASNHNYDGQMMMEAKGAVMENSPDYIMKKMGRTTQRKFRK